MSGKPPPLSKGRTPPWVSRLKNHVSSALSLTSNRRSRHAPAPESVVADPGNVSATTSTLLAQQSPSPQSLQPSIDTRSLSDSFNQHAPHLAPPPLRPPQGNIQFPPYLGAQWPTYQNSGIFSGSSGVSITGVNTFIDHTAPDNFLEKLLQETIRGAEFDSSDRDPPPRCHPKTRLAIIQRCLHFIHKLDDKEKMRWVVGPAGVGKSAVMQIVAEMAAEGFTVASIFFSINERQNGSKAFTTIAYQIAVKCRPYRQFLQGEINRDPDLPRKALSTQFKRFIVEPFVRQHLFDPTQRFLILIDGLDECSDPLTQRNLLGLISDFCIAHRTSPVVWIVASRPEPHITLFFNKAEVKPAYTKEDIVIDSEEGRRDVEVYLRDELGKVQSASITLQRKGEWPSKLDLLKVATASGGLFAYASTVVKYIDDPLYNSPISQLRDVLLAIDEGPRPNMLKGHPLAQLDALYNRILSKVPTHVVVNTKRLLLPHRYWRWGAVKFRIRCNLVGLSEEDAYGAVQHLYSVVKVPDPEKADHQSLQYHHKSFEDFLYDPERSKVFSNIQDEANKLMAEISLRIAEEVLLTLDGEAGGATVKCRDFGYLNVGPSTACANVSLSWPGDEHFEKTDDEVKFELYQSAITAIAERFRDGHKAFVNASCFRVLTRCFSAHDIYFPFQKLQDFAFDGSRRELAQLGMLKQMPIYALDFTAICGRIELRYMRFDSASAEVSDPWEPSCKHKNQRLHGLHGWQGWVTTFGRYEEDMVSSSDREGEDGDNFSTIPGDGESEDPTGQGLEDDECDDASSQILEYDDIEYLLNTAEGDKSHWECLSQTRWNVEACPFCLRRFYYHLIDNSDQPATVFFDSTGLCYVEAVFVDPVDGISQWRYRFLHSGLPSNSSSAISGISETIGFDLPAGQRDPPPFNNSSPLASPLVGSPSLIHSIADAPSGTIGHPVEVDQAFPDDLDIDTVDPDLKQQEVDWFAVGSGDSVPTHTGPGNPPPLSVRSSGHPTTGPGEGAIGPPVGANQVFPDDLDVHTVDPALKKEGTGWFAVFNPKVKRQLDVSLVHTLMHESVVCCVRFSADGKYLATGCNRTAQIYVTKTGQKTCVLVDECAGQSEDLYIRSVCFSPDGKFLATGAEDKQIRIWDIAKKRIRNVFDGHQQEVYSLDFSTDGRLLISGSGDKTARIWDMVDGTSKVLTINDHDSLNNDACVTSVAISPNGQYVAAGSLDTVVRIWDVATGMLVERLRGHRDSVYSVAFTPDGKGLVSGSLDKTLKYWDVSALGGGAGGGPSGALVKRGKDGKRDNKGSPCTMNFTGHKDYVLSVAVSHDGQWVVSGSKDRGVQFWDAKNAIVQCMLQGHKNSVISIDLSPAGSILATGSGDWQARIWSYSPV